MAVLNRGSAEEQVDREKLEREYVVECWRSGDCAGAGTEERKRMGECHHADGLGTRPWLQG